MATVVSDPNAPSRLKDLPPPAAESVGSQWLLADSLFRNCPPNKPGSEGQIPYDLTFDWNISNRRKKQTKYNQRH